MNLLNWLKMTRNGDIFVILLWSSSLQVLTKLKRNGVFPQIITSNKDVFNFLSDLINSRFIHKKKPIRSNFIKIYFENKGIEKINVTKLLHTVTDSIPKTFQDRTPPTVLYTRSPCIGSKILITKK